MIILRTIPHLFPVAALNIIVYKLLISTEPFKVGIRESTEYSCKRKIEDHWWSQNRTFSPMSRDGKYMLEDDGLNIQTALVGTFVYSKKIGQRFALGMRHLGETDQNGVFWGQENIT